MVNNFPAHVNIAKSISWEGEQMMYLERRGPSFGRVKESRRTKKPACPHLSKGKLENSIPEQDGARDRRVV